MTHTIKIDRQHDRSKLRPGMVFKDYAGDFLKLDRTVPGDASSWYAAVWVNGGWSYEDFTLEPSDLDEHLPYFD